MRQKREVNSFIILSISVERCATFYRSTKDMQSMSSIKYALLLVVSSIEHILFTQKLKTNWIPTTNYILLSIIFSEVKTEPKYHFMIWLHFHLEKRLLKIFCQLCLRYLRTTIIRSSVISISDAFCKFSKSFQR